MPGPLSGYRVIELGGIGPVPFGGMMLADMGADVVRVDRVRSVSASGLGPALSPDLLNRGRRSIGVDLKHPDGAATALALIDHADALLEGFRPGVAERLGLGPEVCRARNPRLVYGRMTGWGQDGPMSEAAGHDINFIALSGVLAAIGRQGEAPVPPLNLVGDFGGGGMLLAFGVVCGLLEATSSGQGQVIDAAMVDGAALLSTMFHGLRAMGLWRDERGVNLLDTGAPFYEVYQTADGGHVAVGALEPRFYAELVRLSGLGDNDDQGPLPDQMDQAAWPAMKQRLAALFRTRSRSEWCRVFEGTDACVTPVLGLGEAATHPHNQSRANFEQVAGIVQPSPAPRFGRTPGAISRPPPQPGQHTDEVLADWGIGDADAERLRAAGAIR
ncbi:MAG: CoA transferase [Actinomycetota bacterium]|nr:CoA transferase [Actinomycetota bacterium]